MLGGDTVARPNSRRSFPSAAAVSVSIALHAALLLAVARVTWLAAPAPRRAPAVVWLRDWRPAETEAGSATPAVAPPVNEAVPEQRPPAREAPPVTPAAPAKPARPRPPTSAETRVQPPAPARSEAVPAPNDTARSNEQTHQPIDWNEEMRRAAAAVVEERQREAGYATFSLRDLPDETPPEIGPRPPDHDIFAESRASGSGPALLPYGRSNTKVGRWLSKVCHSLSGGGVSVFGLFSVCAEDRSRGDLFADLKPDYLKIRPEQLTARVRELNDAADARLAPAAQGDTVADADTTVRASLQSSP